MGGLVVLVGVLVAATVFGLWFRRANGRIRDTGTPTAGRRREGSVDPSFVVPAADDEPPVDIESDAATQPDALLAEALVGRAGDRATMVQFSSAFCQPCRATRRILEEVAVAVPGVSHVEIDAEDNLDLVRALGIRRTPTVLFLDSAGIVRKHASGQPRKTDVIAALGELIPSGDPDFEI